MLNFRYHYYIYFDDYNFNGPGGRSDWDKFGWYLTKDQKIYPRDKFGWYLTKDQKIYPSRWLDRVTYVIEIDTANNIPIWSKHKEPNIVGSIVPEQELFLIKMQSGLLYG